MSAHIIWVDVPVADIHRAVAFYSGLLGTPLEVSEMDGRPVAVLATTDDGQAGGQLVQGEGFTPSREGVLMYLSAGEDMDGMLARVAPHGGTVLAGKTAKPYGLMAIFQDTEGNRIGLFGTA